MATTETHQSISDRFNVTESSITRIVSRLSSALTEMSPNLIKWPSVTRINIESLYLKINLNGGYYLKKYV